MFLRESINKIVLQKYGVFVRKNKKSRSVKIIERLILNQN